jgi:hypothetical protein
MAWYDRFAMSTSDPVRIGYTPGQDVTLDHLQDQIEWYDQKSGSNQKAFKSLKSAQYPRRRSSLFLPKSTGCPGSRPD